MTFSNVSFGDVTDNFDKKRIPLSAAQREKRQGKYRYYGAQGVIDWVDDYIFDGTYLLIAEDGENLKSKKSNIAQLVSGKFWVNNHAHVIQCKKGYDIRYLCYLINLTDLSGYITGSAQPKLSQSNMNAIVLPMPKFEIQKEVADFIEKFDKKIQINEEVNDNLLAQAQTIKKQWVATNEAGYEMLPLAEVATINPDTYSPKEAWEFVNYLDTSSITDGFVADIQHIVPSSEKLPSRARRKVAAGDVLFSTVRPNQNHFGIISDPLPNMLASTGFADIRSKTPLVCNELIYLCLTEGDFIEKMQQLAEQSTSTFPSIKSSDLGACQIPCPKDESSNVFNDTLKTLFSLIAANFRENNSLGAMRDALLPKLMSGEIEVSAVKL